MSNTCCQELTRDRGVYVALECDLCGAEITSLNIGEVTEYSVLCLECRRRLDNDRWDIQWWGHSILDTNACVSSSQEARRGLGETGGAT